MPSHLKSITVRGLLSLILTVLLGMPPGSSLAAQIIPAVPAKLNIVVIEGEGAVNSLGQSRARGPIVQVKDQDGRPVAGATVLFLLPDSGPGGAFPHGAHILQVRTDNAGRAVAEGFRANDLQGKFQVEVRASYRGAAATTTITQINSASAPRAGGKSRKLVVILAAVGAAVAAGAVVAARRGGSQSTPISITAGTPTIGAR
jgi:hypothetical protein